MRRAGASCLVIALAGCGAADRPEHAPPDVEHLRALSSELRIVDVSDRPAPTGPQTADLSLEATATRADGTIVVDLVNRTTEAALIGTTDGVPLLVLEAYVDNEQRWVEVWRVSQSTCGNSVWPAQVEPGNLLRMLLKTKSREQPVRARFTLQGNVSNEIEIAVDPELVAAMASIPPTRSSVAQVI